MSDLTMTYSVAQPTREWEWADNTQTSLWSLDGIYEINLDPVYGYWTLSSSENSCISQHQVMHTLVMCADQLP